MLLYKFNYSGEQLTSIISSYENGCLVRVDFFSCNKSLNQSQLFEEIIVTDFINVNADGCLFE